mgnify:FL=1
MEEHFQGQAKMINIYVAEWLLKNFDLSDYGSFEELHLPRRR